MLIKIIMKMHINYNHYFQNLLNLKPNENNKNKDKNNVPFF